MNIERKTLRARLAMQEAVRRRIYDPHVMLIDFAGPTTAAHSSRTS